jgi:hypothetical protein
LPGLEIDFSLLGCPGSTSHKKPRLELIIKRKATGMNAAIWFGGLAGGYEGEVVEFSGDVLRIQ